METKKHFTKAQNLRLSGLKKRLIAIGVDAEAQLRILENAHEAKTRENAWLAKGVDDPFIRSFMEQEEKEKAARELRIAELKANEAGKWERLQLAAKGAIELASKPYRPPEEPKANVRRTFSVPDFS